jgi:hypothetical protein
MNKIEVKCECEGAGFIAVADNDGHGVEHVECGQHHPADQDALSVDELLAHIRKPTGIISKFSKRIFPEVVSGPCLAFIRSLNPLTASNASRRLENSMARAIFSK